MKTIGKIAVLLVIEAFAWSCKCKKEVQTNNLSETTTTIENRLDNHQRTTIDSNAIVEEEWVEFLLDTSRRDSDQRPTLYQIKRGKRIMLFNKQMEQHKEENNLQTVAHENRLEQQKSVKQERSFNQNGLFLTIIMLIIVGVIALRWLK